MLRPARAVVGRLDGVGGEAAKLAAGDGQGRHRNRAVVVERPEHAPAFEEGERWRVEDVASGAVVPLGALLQHERGHLGLAQRIREGAAADGRPDHDHSVLHVTPLCLTAPLQSPLHQAPGPLRHLCTLQWSDRPL